LLVLAQVIAHMVSTIAPVVMTVPPEVHQERCCAAIELDDHGRCGSRRFAEILPSSLRVECAVEYEAPGRSMVSKGACTGIAGPDAFARGGRREQGPARRCRPSGP
jgi:hypothetical protein